MITPIDKLPQLLKEFPGTRKFKFYVRINRGVDLDNQLLNSQDYEFNPEEGSGSENDLQYNNCWVSVGVAILYHAVSNLDAGMVNSLIILIEDDIQYQNKRKIKEDYKKTLLLLNRILFLITHVYKPNSFQQFAVQMFPQNLNEKYQWIYQQTLNSCFYQSLKYLIKHDEVTAIDFEINQDFCTIKQLLGLKFGLVDKRIKEFSPELDVIYLFKDTSQNECPYIVLIQEDLNSIEMKFALKNQILYKNIQLCFLCLGNQQNPYRYLLNQLKIQNPKSFEEFLCQITTYDKQDDGKILRNLFKNDQKILSFMIQIQNGENFPTIELQNNKQVQEESDDEFDPDKEIIKEEVKNSVKKKFNPTIIRQILIKQNFIKR